MKRRFFWSVFFTDFFETADLPSYCGYFLAACQLCQLCSLMHLFRSFLYFLDIWFVIFYMVISYCHLANYSDNSDINVGFAVATAVQHPGTKSYFLFLFLS